MIKRFKLLVLAGAVALGSGAASPLAAQEKQGRGQDPIPAAYKPPAGMCRIWVDGVPPSQQPAPTDCPTAVKNRPDNGRVIFGEPAEKGGKRGEPLLKGFSDKDKKGKTVIRPRRP